MVFWIRIEIFGWIRIQLNADPKHTYSLNYYCIVGKSKPNPPKNPGVIDSTRGPVVEAFAFGNDNHLAVQPYRERTRPSAVMGTN